MARGATSREVGAAPDVPEKRLHRPRLPGVVAVALPGALLSAVVTYLLFSPPRSSAVWLAATPEVSAPAATAPPAPAPSVPPGFHLNEAGDYAFRQPSGWVVNDRGSVSQMRSPNGELVISIGLAGAGTLEDAATQLVRSIEERYRRADVHEPTATELAGRPATVVSGLLVNDAGTRVRFLGAALRVGDRAQVIGMFVSPRAARTPVLSSVEGILVSLRRA